MQRYHTNKQTNKQTEALETFVASAFSHDINFRLFKRIIILLQLSMSEITFRALLTEHSSTGALHRISTSHSLALHTSYRKDNTKKSDIIYKFLEHSTACEKTDTTETLSALKEQDNKNTK
jgi:hypothetical protein